MLNPLKIFKHRHQWKTARTVWPYKHGYGVWCPRCKTILDTGIPTKIEAKDRARSLNQQQKEENEWKIPTMIRNLISVGQGRTA